MYHPRASDSLAQWHELVGMPGQNDAKSARRVELARQLTRGAERQVLFVMPVRADRAGIEAAMAGVDRDDVQRPRPPRETRLLFAVRLARRLGGECAAASGERRGDAGHERAKRPPRDDPVPHPPAPPDRPGTEDDHRADYDEGARSGVLRQIGAVVGRPVFGAPQDDARRRLDEAEAAPQP